MATPLRVLALVDDKPGNRTQTLGVAARLGGTLEVLELHPNRFARLPNLLLGSATIGYTAEDISRLRAACDKSNPPDVVLAAGRKLVPALRRVMRWVPAVYGVYLMHPHHALQRFDLVAIPAHDSPPEAANVVATIGAPHAVTHETIIQHKSAALKAYGAQPQPRIAVLVGGNADGCQFAAQDWQHFGERLGNACVQHGASLLLTTSRRTSAHVADQLQTLLPKSTHIHRWQAEGENPYHAMLSVADAVVVTGESISMLSEACALGVPVYFYNPATGVSTKHARFQQQLVDAGYARPLEDTVALDWQPPAPLDEAGRIAQIIRLRAL